MCSLVDKEKILVDVSHKKDVGSSLPLSHYSNKPSKEDGFNNLLVNHVANLVSRHYSDKIRIALVSVDQGANPGSQADGQGEVQKVLASTQIKLADLNLKSK